MTQLETESLTFEQESGRIQGQLDRYETARVGLPVIGQMVAPKYLDIPPEELRKKTPEDLAEAVLAIRQYSVFIQRAINSERSKITWLKSKLDETYSILIKEQEKGLSWEERAIMRNSHPASKELNSLMREATTKLDRISYLPAELGKIADAVNDLKYIAIRRIQNHEGI